MIPRDLQYDLPQAIYLLFLAIPIAIMFWALNNYRHQSLKRFATQQSLSILLTPRSRIYNILHTCALCLAWIAAVIALMQPKGNGRYPESNQDPYSKTILEETITSNDSKETTVQRKAHDVIFLVDASASMSVSDTRVGLSRLEYAKEIIEETVKQLKGHTVSLYTFTSETSTIVPPTFDTLYLRMMARTIDINEGDVAGTDLLEALDTMRSKHFSKESQKLRTLIILTDGGDTRIEALFGDQRSQEIATLISRLNNAENMNLRTFSIGLGSKQGEDIPGILFQGSPVKSSLDENLLKMLSKHGRGRYYFASDFSSLGIASDIIAQ